MAEEDDSQKTEEPTERRLEEALKSGQIIFSKEITNFLMLLVLTIIIVWLVPKIMRRVSFNLSSYIENSHQIELNEEGIGLVLSKMVRDFADWMFLPLLVTVITALSSAIIQSRGRIITSLQPITPDLSKISLISGFGRLFSVRSIVELIKGVVKIIVIGIVCYISVKSSLNKLELIYDYSLASILKFLLDLSIDMMIGVCITMAIIAGFDYMYQRHEFYQKVRMSKQELKEEYRETEGSPEIKAKLKRIRQERAKKRMMAAVPTADVIITNPTHFSIALKYELGTMRAPVVVAKGQDAIALTIREVAKKNNVPLYENAPLARILYKTVDIDDEIPGEHYQAVAEIITYVYKLKGKLH
jgi:flagellar biosynthetic protein FlhB